MAFQPLMFSRVLVPLDGSEITQAILPYVSQLAKGLEIPVVVLSVIEELVYGRAASLRQSVYKEIERRANNQLREVVARLNRDGVRAEAMTTRGRAADEIVATAERHGCDLIAMTTHGSNLVARGKLGSVADKVVHSSQVPVLMITPERAATYGSSWTGFTKAAEGMMNKMMVSLDGSPLAETVLPYVQALAGKLSLRVLLVRVIQGLRVEWLDWQQSSPADTEEEKEAELEAGAYLERISRTLGGAGIEARWQVLLGHPATVIAELAQLEPHDIIALASRGGDHWPLGSVAEALVRATADPVLVVTQRKGGYAAGPGSVVAPPAPGLT